MKRLNHIWPLFPAIFALSSVFYSCREDFEVIGIMVDKNEFRLVKGDTIQLEATIDPFNATNDFIIWESDNNDIAWVDDDGLVTASGPGKVIIRAITDDGGFEDSCIIVVGRVSASCKKTGCKKQIKFFNGLYSFKPGSAFIQDLKTNNNIRIGGGFFPKMSAESGSDVCLYYPTPCFTAHKYSKNSTSAKFTDAVHLHSRFCKSVKCNEDATVADNGSSGKVVEKFL
jgi:hypothetical protein